MIVNSYWLFFLFGLFFWKTLSATLRENLVLAGLRRLNCSCSDEKVCLVVVCRCPAHHNWRTCTQQVKYWDEGKHRLEVQILTLQLHFSLLVDITFLVEPCILCWICNEKQSFMFLKTCTCTLTMLKRLSFQPNPTVIAILSFHPSRHRWRFVYLPGSLFEEKCYVHKEIHKILPHKLNFFVFILLEWDVQVGQGPIRLFIILDSLL